MVKKYQGSANLKLNRPEQAGSAKEVYINTDQTSAMEEGMPRLGTVIKDTGRELIALREGAEQLRSVLARLDPRVAYRREVAANSHYSSHTVNGQAINNLNLVSEILDEIQDIYNQVCVNIVSDADYNDDEVLNLD